MDSRERLERRADSLELTRHLNIEIVFFSRREKFSMRIVNTHNNIHEHRHPIGTFYFVEAIENIVFGF